MLCRLFFVVNKVDTIRMSEGLDEDATREYVAELVTAQLSGDGFQLHPEQVVILTFRHPGLSVSGCSPHYGCQTACVMLLVCRQRIHSAKHNHWQECSMLLLSR